MKLILVIGIALLSGCASLGSQYVNPASVDFPALEEEVKADIELYPARLEYAVQIVANVAAVRKLFNEKSGRKSRGVQAFYLSREKLIVLPRATTIEIIRHEVGHAIVDAYFKMPVPRWLHETIAREAEK
jgi:hypothetical protein